MALIKTTTEQHPFFRENGKPKEFTPYVMIDNILILTNGTEQETPQIEFLLRTYDGKETRDFEQGMAVGNKKVKFKGEEYAKLRPLLNDFLAKCYELLFEEIEIEVEEEGENELGEKAKVMKKKKTSILDKKEYSNG